MIDATETGTDAALDLALRREAALREVLAVISRSRGDEAPVFDAILRHAQTLCDAPMAALVLGAPGDAALSIPAHRGVLPQTVEMFDTGRMLMDRDLSYAARAILDAELIAFDDMGQSALYAAGSPVVRGMVEESGIRSVLFAPLVQDGGAIGALTLFRHDVAPFDADEIALVEAFAAQAVVAIENVRQFRELQTRLEREAATRGILEVISGSRDDEQPVFDAILEAASKLCRAPLAFLTLADEPRENVVVPAYRGTTPEFGAILDTFAEPIGRSELVAVRPIATGEVMRIGDMKDTDLYRSGEPRRLQMVDVEGVRSVVGVPLLRGGVGIGCLVLYRREVTPFSDDDVSLVQAFAAQAVIAIENVRQFRELQTRLEREAATRDVLEVISGSRDDEAPVFDAILEAASRLCDAPLAYLVMADGDGGHVRCPARRGAFVAFGETLDQLRVKVDSRLALVRSFVEGRVIRVDDIADDDLYRAGDPNRVSMVEDEGARSILVAPLMRGETGLGSITLYRREVRPFSDDDVALVEAFAAQAVIAIENVRQFRELQTRLEREAATREILEVISSSRDDDAPVFDAILDRARSLCGAVASALLLGTPDGGRLILAAFSGAERVARTEHIDQANAVPMAMDPDVHIAARAICSGEAVHVADISDTDAYRRGETSFRLMVDEQGLRSTLSVPLMSGGRAIGAISLHRRETVLFSPDEVALVEAFAAQAVIAIENVRQFRELRARLERETATRDILHVISQSRDDERPVFEAVLRAASRLCGAESAGLLLRGEDGATLRLAALDYDDAAQARDNDEVIARVNATPMDLDPDLHIAARAIVTGEVQHIEDLADTDAYRAGEPTRLIMVDENGQRTALSVPLFVGDEAVGAINLHRCEKRAFSPEQIALAQTFAAQAAIAIENVRQFKALESLNAELGERVEAQVGEIERMSRLKRFLSPAVAQAITSSGSEAKLTSHRALVAVLFADIRGFTAFCETAEPEETIEVLQTYHEEMGRLLHEHGAGVDHRSGDGIMAIFNDPLPCDDPAGDAVRLAVAMRARMRELCAGWRKLGHRLGFGVGVSLGYATVGMVGSEGRYDYTASGTAVNLGARLCDRAEDGEILLSPRAATAVEEDFETETVGEIDFKGIREPVEVFRLVAPAEA